MAPLKNRFEIILQMSRTFQLLNLDGRIAMRSCVHTAATANLLMVGTELVSKLELRVSSKSIERWHCGLKSFTQAEEPCTSSRSSST